MNITEAQIRTMLVSFLKMTKTQGETWLDTPLEEFSWTPQPSGNKSVIILKTPLQLIEEGRGSELVTVITETLPNGRPNEKNERN